METEENKPQQKSQESPNVAISISELLQACVEKHYIRPLRSNEIESMNYRALTSFLRTAAVRAFRANDQTELATALRAALDNYDF